MHEHRGSALERVDAEMNAGRTWRAKEILRGAIASGRAEAAIFERFVDLPDAVQSDLRELRVAPDLFGRSAGGTAAGPPHRSLWDRFIILISLLVVVIFVLALALGIWVIGDWLLNLVGVGRASRGGG